MVTTTTQANTQIFSSPIIQKSIQHLVFIDSNVPDYDYLARGVIPGAEVIILEPDRDGIKQITKVLSSYSFSNSVSLHLVSHGSPGCLYLGNSQLSLDTLAEYTEDLKTWSNQLSIVHCPLSIALYGCNVAAGDAGAEFIAKLNQITGAEIAASTTPVGNAAKDGNWELDYQTESITIPLIFREEIQNNYTAIFADEKFSLGNRIWEDLDNDGQLNGSESGIDGVVVNLYEDSDNDGNPNGGIIDTTTTADGGYYRFDNLDASNYIVEIAASNFNTGNALDGLISSSSDEVEPDNDIDLNDNGIGTTPDPTNGIRSNSITLDPGFNEPTGEDFVPPPTTSTSIDLTQTATTGGNGTNVRMNGVDSSNAGSTTGRITLEFEPERFIIDVTGFGNDLVGFCLEFAELSSPNLNYTAVNATTTGPFFNSSYNDPGDIPNFYGPGDNPDPNSIPADYGIVTQDELDIISTVWANVESTITTNANDAAALQLLIWELQNDQTFDLDNGNFILDATGGSSTVDANTSAAIATVNSWYTNATDGTWTGSVPLALLTVEDQQDIIVSFDLGVGATDSQSNLTVDFAFTDPIDYGDAPDTLSGGVDVATTGDIPDYQTTESDGGASHVIVSGLGIGNTIDADNGTLQDNTATADDSSNTGSADDEDGVTFSVNPLQTGSDSYTVDVVINNDAGANVNLVGWIDFDQSGTFDSDEAATLSGALGDGSTQQLTWDSSEIPDDIIAGDTYARFRLSTDSISTSTGSVGQLTDGEVEDYALNIKNEVTGTGASEVINDSFSDPTTSGNDFIIGGAGQDTLTGNGGNDCFHFNQTSDGIDLITDFNQSGVDKIDLSDFFATGGELEGITTPFGTYVEALPVGSSGTLIQIDFDNSDNNLLKKNLVYLDGYTTTMTADDFIF